MTESNPPKPVLEYQFPISDGSDAEPSTARQPAAGAPEDQKEEQQERIDEGAESEALDSDEQERLRHARELLQTQKVLKSGHLNYRSGKRRKVWKRYWFVLRSSSLAYYKDESEYKCRRLIYLADIYHLAEAPKKKSDRVFGIMALGKIYYLEASTRDEMQTWIATIKEAVAKLRLEDTSGSQSNISSMHSLAVPPLAQTSRTPAKVPPPAQEPAGRAAPDAASLPVLTVKNAGPAPEVLPDGACPDPPSPGLEPIAEGGAEDLSSEEYECPVSPALQRSASLYEGKLIMRGYLYKRDNYLFWKKRWFVLRQASISTFTNEDEKMIHRVLRKNDVEDVQIADAPSKKPRHCFVIKARHKQYMLSTDSRDNLHRWVGALRRWKGLPALDAPSGSQP